MSKQKVVFRVHLLYPIFKYTELIKIMYKMENYDWKEQVSSFFLETKKLTFCNLKKMVHQAFVRNMHLTG